MSTNNQKSSPRCPCYKFTDMDSICVALTDAEETTINELVQLLSTREAQNCKRPGLPCSNRIHISFSILKEIRKTCSHYVEQEIQSQSDKKKRTIVPTPTKQTYEAEFPSLLGGGGSVGNNCKSTPSSPKAISAARVKPKKKIALGALVSSSATTNKPKRRIRPISTTTISAHNGNISSLTSQVPFESSSIKGNIAALPSQSIGPISTTTSPLQNGNISSLPSQEPFRLSSREGTATATNLSSHRIQSIPTTRLQNGNVLSVPSEQPFGPTVMEDNIENTSSFTSNDEFRIRKPPAASVWPPTRTEQAKVKHTMEVPKEEERTPKSLDSATITRLADIYSVLIQESLVPSTPLELHFLVRVLSISSNHCGAPSPESEGALHFVLVSPEACRILATKTLSKLECVIGNLPLQMLSAFSKSMVIHDAAPQELIKRLTDRLEQRNEQAEVSDSGIGGDNLQAILALPFDAKRDSRHNYKTRDETALYKNREESRDAFLYQLRHFQNIRGKGFDIATIEQKQRNIRQSARIVVSGVNSENFHWFAQFFVDLLLQIGLVPMEETDRDILSIADKDKLQKLHKRFSSKVGNSKGSSTKFLSSNGNETLSPEKEALQRFPGHQEFFFLFIRASDSYSLCSHIKTRLVALIREMHSHETKNVQQRLAKLQVLARFLGVVTFGPTWHKSSTLGVLQKMSREETSIWVNVADLSALQLDAILDRAQSDKALFATIPWVVEFLHMAKWDRISLLTNPLKSLLSRLVSQHDIAKRDTKSPSLCSVSLHLESFFFKTVGLVQIDSLARHKYDSHEARPDDTKGIDEHDFELSDSFLFASIGHAEELISLLATSQQRSKLSGTPRKMRPSIVSASTSSFSSLSLTTEDAPISVSPAKKSGSSSTTDEKSVVLAKLVEMFFHQHRDLKEICDFVVTRALEKALATLVDADLKDYIESLDENDNPCGDDTDHSAFIEKSRQAIQSSLASTISQSLHLLDQGRRSPRVLEIATELAVTHALKSVEQKISTVVTTEAKKLKPRRPQAKAP